jgi:hypothetical protein
VDADRLALNPLGSQRRGNGEGILLKGVLRRQDFRDADVARNGRIPHADGMDGQMPIVGKAGDLLRRSTLIDPTVGKYPTPAIGLAEATPARRRARSGSLPGRCRLSAGSPRAGKRSHAAAARSEVELSRMLACNLASSLKL